MLQRLAVTDPGKLATIAYGLLPKDIFVKVGNTDPLSQLDDEALADLQRPAGNDPSGEGGWGRR